MGIDWNPVVHILDELSDGTHSLLELSYLGRRYERAAFLDSLLFLADRHLVELSEGREQLTLIPRTEWPKRLSEAFGFEAASPDVMTRTSIDLTGDGEQVLRLLNIAQPPSSQPENVC
jgi:hypothetical protein